MTVGMQLLDGVSRGNAAESTGFQERSIGFVQIIAKCVCIAALAVLFLFAGKYEELFFLLSFCGEVYAVNRDFFRCCLSELQQEFFAFVIDGDDMYLECVRQIFQCV